MRRVALKVAYIGTGFYGFQRQPGLTTVEGELLSALKMIGYINEISECGFGIGGRTDRGVHALGNVVSFLTDGEVIINQINDALPTSIRVLGKAKVPLHFKARYAENRYYRYLLVNEADIPESNLEEMVKAASLLKGTHNFSNFSKRSERNPVRTVHDINVTVDDGVIRVDVVGESFLWNMIRKIVTVLLSVSLGELKSDDIFEYLDPQRDVNIQPASPGGLILMDVRYNGLEFQYDSYAKNNFISSLRKEYRHLQTIALSEYEMIKNLIE